jgi:two-component system, LytTR family, sensor kinase
MDMHAKPRPGPRWWLLVLVALAFWQVLGFLDVAWFVLISAARGDAVVWNKLIQANLPLWLIVAAFTPPVIWLARRYPWVEGRRRRAIFVHAAGLVAFTVLHTVTVQLWYALRNPKGFDTGMFVVAIPKMVASIMDRGIMFYLIIIGGTWLVETYARYREREREAAALELERAQLRASLSEARLEALRMQLQPHFLFNTLHAISTLVLKGETRAADQMLAHLSRFLRLTLESAQVQTVSLALELEFLDAYLRIQEVRLGNRLTVRNEIEEQALVAAVPSLILQPLVENSIQHGIGRKPEGGTIAVRARRDGDTVVLEVEDDGVGLKGDPESATGIGLRNIRERLVQLYPGEHGFSLGAAPGGGTLATVTIPFRRARGGGGDGPDPDPDR